MTRSEWMNQCADVLIDYGSIPCLAKISALSYQRENYLSEDDLIAIDPTKAAIEIMGGTSARNFH